MHDIDRFNQLEMRPTHSATAFQPRLNHILQWESINVSYLTLVTDGYEPTIQAAIQQFAQHTCIRWKPVEDEEKWVKFVKKTG